MTRLKTTDIASIKDELPTYEQGLIKSTGHSLEEIGVLSANFLALNDGPKDEAKINKIMAELKPADYSIAVIPVTAGQGKIKGFSQAVAAILQYLNFPTEITTNTDVAGIREALKKKHDIMFLADDKRFIAKNTDSYCWIDNDRATALAYLIALELMAGELEDREVLVLGAGRVGREAVKILLKKEAKPVIYDKALNKKDLRTGELSQFARERISIKEKIDVSQYSLIFEATPARDLLKASDITDQTFVAAPGIPAGFTTAAAEKLGANLIHDPLQLGVTAMAFSLIR